MDRELYHKFLKWKNGGKEVESTKEEIEILKSVKDFYNRGWYFYPSDIKDEKEITAIYEAVEEREKEIKMEELAKKEEDESVEKIKDRNECLMLDIKRYQSLLDSLFETLGKDLEAVESIRKDLKQAIEDIEDIKCDLTYWGMDAIYNH